MVSIPRVAGLAASALVLCVRAAGAQGLPSEPISLFQGRLVLSGEAAATIGPEDEEAWFNYTDYDHNALRMIRLALSATVRLGDRVSLLGQLRTENLDAVRPYALYVRVRPWADRDVDIQAGMIPPTFGAFARRGYGNDNPLIGLPLAYQYLTSMRGNAVPATANDLLQMRGRGWRVTYPVGSPAPEGGLPLVNALRWDTGVQMRAGWRIVDVSAAVTSGTLANPRIEDDNDGKQVSARVELHPSPAITLGVSAARGASLSREVTGGLSPDLESASYTQRTLGLDVEVSRGHWIARGEGVFTSWNLPAVRAPAIAGRLGAHAVSFEGRYTVMPGVYVAARADWLGFGEVTSPTRGPLQWDAPVRRIEIGGGYYLRRNLLVKGVYQHNRRTTAATRTLGVPSVQVLYWF